MAGEGAMPQKREKINILALVPEHMREALELDLASLDTTIAFIDCASELSSRAKDLDVCQVALIPAELPDQNWWIVWREFSLLSHRPSILVYTETDSFELWSGVLEAGGFDVLPVPFDRETVCDAISRAAKNFAERFTNKRKKRLIET